MDNVVIGPTSNSAYLRLYESENNGVVDMHPLHGQDELSDNLTAARILANHGHFIELLPTIPAAEVDARLKWIPDVFGSKNPDVRIDKKIIGDIKTPGYETTIKQSVINRCIYAGAQQKATLVIINLLHKEYAVHDVKKGIIGALQPNRNKTISEIWIITNKGNLFKAKREMIFDESIYEELNKL